MRRIRIIAGVAFALALAGCNKEDPAQLAADGKATGAACRHAGRAIEDCFAQNPDALRGAVFDGWKEMNDYMRENKIAEVKPQPKAEGDAGHGEEHADASHEGDAAHGESNESAGAEANADKTKVAAAAQGDAHAEESEGKSATTAEHPESAGEKH